MILSLSEAADRLGKTQRQIRYLIQQGRLPARKDGGRWAIDSADLPQSEAHGEAVARQAAGLRDAVDRALGPRAMVRHSLRDLKAVGAAVPLYRQATELLGSDSIVATELRTCLDQLAIGYHRWGPSEKRDAYRAARDSAARAGAALLLADEPGATELLDAIEQGLMPAIAGLLRRTERCRDRD